MESRQIILAGIGMGSAQLITEEVRQLIETADCLIGAERMLACAQQIRSEALTDVQEQKKDRKKCALFREYRTEEIVSYIKEHEEYRKIGILLSGDTGFYSGARKLKERLSQESQRKEGHVTFTTVTEKSERESVREDTDLLEKADSGFCDIRIFPGISSLSYLASRVGISWEDAVILSLHGKEMNFVQTIDRHPKTFLLLGGKGTGQHFYETLREYQMDEMIVHIGRNMSYEEERILSDRLDNLKPEDFEGLCAVLVENPGYCKDAGMHLKDEAFIRGKVPMTKSEVRSVSVAELELTEDAVVYDIGAGTGSVSVEIARAGEQIRVYAIEKNPEGVKLIDENRKKFRTDGIRIVEGLAPEVMEELEAPTHAFIGGSSGNLKDIVRVLQEKNPSVRVVINAISLETVSEVMELVEEGLLPDAEILQVSTARSKVLGRYHMMMGQNPVYIVSAGSISNTNRSS